MSGVRLEGGSCIITSFKDSCLLSCGLYGIACKLGVRVVVVDSRYAAEGSGFRDVGVNCEGDEDY